MCSGHFLSHGQLVDQRRFFSSTSSGLVLDGSIDLFKLLHTLSAVNLISRSFGNSKNRTRGCWVRSANVTSVLCCAPPNAGFVIHGHPKLRETKVQRYLLPLMGHPALTLCSIDTVNMHLAELNPCVSLREKLNDSSKAC